MTSAELLASNAALSSEVRRSHEALKIAQLTIDKMKVELAYLRRMKYGRSSEKLEHPQPQLELVGGQLAAVVVESSADAGEDDGLKSNVTSLEKERKKREPKTRPGLRELPEHLPRRTVVHNPQGGCDCAACGAVLREIGQDVSEVLDYVPGTFHVVRHVRPKLVCAGCKTITQALAPSRPVDRCMAGAGLLTHMVVSKFADHVPLYRLCQIYGRDGVELSRSTITDMVGNCGLLLTPLADAVGRYVLKAHKVHGDDTPIRALGGKGQTAHTGRLWVYVRDDRPSGDQAPPAVWFQYAANRKGEHPARHLKHFIGVLQADAYAGYNAIYKGGRVVEAGCWSHARRKLWDICATSWSASPTIPATASTSCYREWLPRRGRTRPRPKHCRWPLDGAGPTSRTSFGKVGAMSTKPLGSGASAQAYQLLVELDWVQPKVWRRLLVPITIDLPLLHATLLFGMGWLGGHIHEFVIGRDSYGPMDMADLDDIADEEGVTLRDALGAKKTFTYVYDYGDDWRHKVKVEKVVTLDVPIDRGVCIGGENACPPEDVGGPPGYEEFLAALADPNHSEHRDLKDWIGSSFDPAAFSIEEVNDRLSSTE